MENKTILMGLSLVGHRLSEFWRILRLVVPIAGLSLILCSCVSVHAPEVWHCVDDKGKPLEGVIVFYTYYGHSLGATYSRTGGYVISDQNGNATLPLDAARRSPIPFEGEAERKILFVYSTKTHSSYGGTIGDYVGWVDENDIDSFKKNIYLSYNNDPSVWFLGLASAVNLSARKNAVPPGRSSDVLRQILEQDCHEFITLHGNDAVPAALHPMSSNSPHAFFKDELLKFMQYWGEEL